jgi:tRNA(Ile)-lysidine synthase
VSRQKGEGGHALPDLFAHAADALRAQHPSLRMAVAFSGGLDSTVLLHLAAAWSARQGLPLCAFHVHHGLSPQADAWLEHCARAAQGAGASFDARRVQLDAGKRGTEASARKARYAALGELCAAYGANVLLTAHHLDDQAETVLLQLLRGAGPAGLSGMDDSNHAPQLLGPANVLLARPLLAAGRAELESYARGAHLSWIEDESNADTRFARNALRHGVMPQLARDFPGFQQRLARAAAHAQSAQRLLDVLAAQDLAAAGSADGSLDCHALRALGADRANNLLRHWLHVHRLAMPSTAWLAELLVQATTAQDDAQVRVVHPEREVRRHRNRLYLVAPFVPPAEPVVLRWNGEPSLRVNAFHGALHFESAASGVDPDWLRGQQLQVEVRRGSEPFKPAAARPTRSLKHHYQSLDIPLWERERLPVVRAGRDLLYAAGVGQDCRRAAVPGGIVLRWEPDPVIG